MPGWSTKRRLTEAQKELIFSPVGQARHIAGQCVRCGAQLNARRLMYFCRLCRAHFNYFKHKEKNHDKLRAASVAYYRKLRRAVVALYGEQCGWCGETNPKILTLDHVNCDGAEERRKNGRGSWKLLREILQSRELRKDLQVLCWNCNMAKKDDSRYRPAMESSFPWVPEARSA